jgi:transcription factor C subunit 6
MVATAGSDGSLLLANNQQGFHRTRFGVCFSHLGVTGSNAQGLTYKRVYEMDFSASTGEWRMVDDMLPEVSRCISVVSIRRRSPSDTYRSTSDNLSSLQTMSLEAAGAKKISKHNAAVDPSLAKTAAWAPEVGVHKVAWQNAGGLGMAGLLASGTASGLGRVDIIRGRFRNGEAPE